MKLAQKLIERFRAEGGVNFPHWLDKGVFMNNKVTLTDKQIAVCEQFAEDRMAGSLKMYQSRNNASVDKIRSDIVTGAKGEMGICKFIRELGYNISDPDFNIYKRGEKSWDADMRIDFDGKLLDVHCKTQSAESAKRYGVSWILQYGRGQDKLFKHQGENDFLAMAKVGVDGNVEILGFLPIKFIFDNDLIGEPKIPWLQGIKKALYLDDIDKKDLWQLP